MPMRSATIKDKAGNPCTTPEEQQDRWRRRFASIPDIQLQFDPEEMEKVKQRPIRTEKKQLIISYVMERQMESPISFQKWSRQLAVR